MAPVRIMHLVLGNDVNSSNAMLNFCYDYSYNPDGTFEDIKDYITHATYANGELRKAAGKVDSNYFTTTAARYCSFRATEAFDVLVGYELMARTSWRGALSLCGPVEQNAALGTAADLAEVPYFVGNSNNERGEVGVGFPATFLRCYTKVYPILLAVEALYELTCFETVNVENPEEMNFLCRYLRQQDWDFTVRITGEQTASERGHINDIAKQHYVTVENYNESSSDNDDDDDD